MKEGLNKEFKITPEQKDIELKNHSEMEDRLRNEFSEILKENPVEIFTKHGDYKANKTGIIFNDVKSLQTDKTGTGGIISIEFNFNKGISIRKDVFDGGTYFSKKNDYYKISEASFHNIINTMDQLIKKSGYSDLEKEKMLQSVIDGLKNKIIKEEDIKEAR